MFQSLRSPSSSPCPSPVREFAATLRRASIPICGRYKSLVGSQVPIISKGRLTMTGGFTDLRQRSIDRADSLESEGETSSSSRYSSRSVSCESCDAILEPQAAKLVRRYFKIPKKALTAAMGHLSPSSRKKLRTATEAASTPQHPMWPTVMATYGRGVSSFPVHDIMLSLEPSLTAMKAQAILDDRRDMRSALKTFINKAKLQRQVETLISAASVHLNLEENNPNDESFDSDDSQNEAADRRASDCEGDEPTPLALHELFLINPTRKVRCSGDRTGTPDEGFQEESLLDALDLDAVPTLTPEELLSMPVSDVCNVHVICDYVVLETAPASDSVFV